MKVKKMGNIYGFTGGCYAGNVYDKKGLAPNFNGMEGGNRQPMIIEDFYKNRDERVYKEIAPTIRSDRTGLKTIVAMRGRNPENPSDRRADIELEQRLEPQKEGICNTLTSVCKDNLVVEQKLISTKGKEIEVASTILEGYHRTNMTGFNADNGVCETVKIKQATDKGCIECKIGGVADLSFPNSTTCRGRVQDGGDVSPGLAMTHPAQILGMNDYRIRKLTPLECWRLMGFTDEEFQKAEAVNSNTQLYKQAGNSIVVDVLQYIFKEIIEAMEEEEMKKIEEVKTVKFETDKMIDVAKLQEAEPELFDELAADYPCEDATYIFKVQSVG